MASNQYLTAYMTGVDKDTPPTSFQNVMMNYPMVIESIKEMNINDIVTKYRQSGISTEMSNAIIILEIKPNVKMTSSMITAAFGKTFTYEKVLYIACQPNSFLSGRIQIYTSDDTLPIDALKVPCVSTEQMTHTWTAILDI